MLGGRLGRPKQRSVRRVRTGADGEKGAASKLSRRWGLLLSELGSPANRSPAIRLLFWVLLQAIIVNVVIAAVRLPDAFWVLTPWSSTPRATFDSWRPIADAVRSVTDHGGAGLYQRVYFESSHQFTYSPQSLALFDLVERAGLVSWGNYAALNVVSQLVLLTVGVCAGLAQRSMSLGESLSLGGAVPCILLGLVTTFLFYPAIRGFELGQIQTWLTLLLTLAIWAHAAGRKLTAGVLLGLLMIVKPYYALALLWALLSGERRVLAGQLAVLTATTGLSVALYGFPIHVEFVDLLGALGRRGESFHANQSLAGLLHRAVFNGNNLVWDPWHRSTPELGWVNAVSRSWGLGWVLAALIAARKGDRRTGLWLVLVTTLVASPVAYEHYYALCIPIFIALGLHALREGRLSIRTLLLASSFIVAGNFLGLTRSLAASRWNVFQSGLFFAGVTLLLLLHVHHARAAREGAPA